MFPNTPSQLLPNLIDQYNELHPEKPLARIRLHDLRHVHATTLRLAGEPVHVVAARLGHADPSITLRVYAHVIQDLAPAVADTFAQAVSEAARADRKGAKKGAVSKQNRAAARSGGHRATD